MRKRHAMRVPGVIALAFAIAGLLPAQVDKGTITGMVTDPSGAVVPETQVTALNVATGVSHKAVTNASGLYSVLNLPIGKYNLDFEKEGFKTLRREGITIQVAQISQINVTLQVGAVTESVSVTGEASILKTESASVGTTMGSLTVTDLPLSAQGGRNVESFAFAVTPNLTGDWYSSRVAGSPTFTKNVIIDGTSAEAGPTGDLGEMSPTMEAVQEFQVDTTGVRAEAARGSGAMMFSLKSGTNQLHGSAFGFLANEVLNANTWDNNFFGTPRARSRYNDYGFSAGGPVVLPKLYNGKNKTFIFGAYEKYMESNWIMRGGSTTVPTPAFLNGDFSALLDKNTVLGADSAGNTIYKGAIFDPLTGNVFAGNIIPANRISAKSKKLVDIFKQHYAPALPGLINNAGVPASGTPWFHQTQFTTKLDHIISDTNRLSFSYILSRRPRIGIFSPTMWEQGTMYGGPFAVSRLQTVNGNMLRLQDSHTFTPTLLNVLSLTYNEYSNSALAGSLQEGDIDGSSLLGLSSPYRIMPIVSFGGGRNGVSLPPIAGRGDVGGAVATHRILNETLTWVRGRQTIRIGGEFRAIGMNSASGGAGGVYSFAFSPTTGAPTNTKIQPYVGFGFANFLLGAVQSASVSQGLGLYGRRKGFALFIQDDFKVNPKLTITADLRWDVTMPFKEKYGHMVNFDLNASNPAYGNYKGALVWAKNGETTFEPNQYWGNVGPHIGAAYRALPKLVVRGGYGIVYVGIGNNIWSGVPYGYAPGFMGVNTVTKVSDQAAAFNWDNGYPGKTVYPTSGGSTIPWGPVSYNPDATRLGYTQNWNAGVQYEISRDTVFEANYIGNKGSRLHDGSLNPANFPTWSAYQKLIASGHVNDWVWDQGSADAAGVPFPYAGFSAPAYMAINPYPQVAEQTWGPIYFIGSGLGSSDYRALSLEFRKRGGHGLSTNFSYTLSRTRGNTSSAFDESWNIAGFQDPYQLAQEAKVLASYDMTHVVKGYLTYELPFGRGRMFLGSSNRLAEKLVSGWTLGALFQYNSGMPMSAPRSTLSYPGWSALFANVAPNADFSNTFKGLDLAAKATNTVDPNARFFNPANFTNPKVGELGNAPRTFVNWRNWAYAYENLSILKKTAFGPDGRYQVTLRAEFINLFNRHYWGGPNMDMNSKFFGQVQSVWGNRTGQVGARFEF